jgi:hypothetical protein
LNWAESILRIFQFRAQEKLLQARAREVMRAAKLHGRLDAGCIYRIASDKTLTEALMTIFEELMRLRNARLKVEKSLLKPVLLKVSAHELHTLSDDELLHLENVYTEIEYLNEMMLSWLNKNQSWDRTADAPGGQCGNGNDPPSLDTE